MLCLLAECLHRLSSHKLKTENLISTKQNDFHELAWLETEWIGMQFIKVGIVKIQCCIFCTLIAIVFSSNSCNQYKRLSHWSHTEIIQAGFNGIKFIIINYNLFEIINKQLNFHSKSNRKIAKFEKMFEFRSRYELFSVQIKITLNLRFFKLKNNLFNPKSNKLTTCLSLFTTFQRQKKNWQKVHKARKTKVETKEK